MPTYDYLCAKCGKGFERMVPMSERDWVICECGYQAQRLLAAPHGRVVGGTERSNPINYADHATRDLTGLPMDYIKNSALHTPIKRPGSGD